MRSSHDLAGWFGRGSLRRLATGFFSEAELSHEAGPPSKGFGPVLSSGMRRLEQQLGTVRLRHRNPQLAELPMNADLERSFRPVVIRAHGQVETEVPLSVPRWPRAVR